MRIIIDIGHPAHVHYFRNFISIMQSRGHEFLITARNRKDVFELLSAYGLDYVNRGKGSSTLVGKLLYLPRADLKLFRLSRQFRPDLFLSFGSMYAAHAAQMLRRPHIAFDDTEHARLGHLMYVPFTDKIYTPTCFNKDLGKNHTRFDGYMELCYLHPRYFKPDPSILHMLGVDKGERYVIMRFISWGASHDAGHYGFDVEARLRIASELSKYARVFISAEAELSEELKSYQLNIPPEFIHDVLAYASLFVGESGTMSTEAALLGTPTVCVSTIAKLLGNFYELRGRYGLLFFYDDSQEGLDKALELLNGEVELEWQHRREKMLSDKIDVTQFMLEVVSKWDD